KMASADAPVNIASSPRTSNGRVSALGRAVPGLGSIAVCSAIPAFLLRDRPVGEVSCYTSDVIPPRDSRFAAQASLLEIDAGALRHNVATFREVLGPGVRVGGVLKGNAYGHGFEQVLPIAHAACDALYVIDPRDALLVRAFEKNNARSQRQVVVLG